MHVVDLDIRVNDPSAGSPTETLLRLLLPLSDAMRCDAITYLTYLLSLISYLLSL